MARKLEMTSEDCRKVAEAWTSQQLIAIWEDLKQGTRLANWPEGWTFEHLVIRAFQRENLTVRWPYRVTYPQKFGTMEQFDGVVYLDQRPFLIESKDLSEAAAIEAFAKLRFRLEARPPGTMGILFSVRDFTLPTEVFAQFASPLNVLLWSSTDLERALQQSAMKESLQQKLHYAIEEGLPLYPLGGTS